VPFASDVFAAVVFVSFPRRGIGPGTVRFVTFLSCDRLTWFDSFAVPLIGGPVRLPGAVTDDRLAADWFVVVRLVSVRLVVFPVPVTVAFGGTVPDRLSVMFAPPVTLVRFDWLVVTFLSVALVTTVVFDALVTTVVFDRLVVPAVDDRLVAAVRFDPVDRFVALTDVLVGAVSDDPAVPFDWFTVPFMIGADGPVVFVRFVALTAAVVFVALTDLFEPVLPDPLKIPGEPFSDSLSAVMFPVTPPFAATARRLKTAMNRRNRASGRACPVSRRPVSAV
jgi:hypothetical protein